MRSRLATAAAVIATALAVMTPTSPLDAHAPSGAIFTTVDDGTEVNFNIYPSKEAVYLDGGPGPGAPQTAAGLDDGTYLFQVTDPSGKTLLSQDGVECRTFTVTDGVISGLANPGGACTSVHLTGFDADWGATTIQLMPYADTPNNGDEYKVWITRIEDYDPTFTAPGSKFGFVPAHSKTDNFKVGGIIREIDVKFFPDTGNGRQDYWEADLILGLSVKWTDTRGASNKKWSLRNYALQVYDYAHIEAVEPGTHSITVTDQENCTVGDVRLDYGPDDPDTGTYLGTGAGTYPVKINKWGRDWGVFVEVACL